MIDSFPFPTLRKLRREIGASWEGFELAASTTLQAEVKLHEALSKDGNVSRLLNPDVSLILFGSLARYEMTPGSDCDWALLLDGVVDNDHAELGRTIGGAIRQAGIRLPGASGVFGNMVFSHDLVHRIGGGADSNENLTRRMLMLLESRPLGQSGTDFFEPVWENVLSNILERYFEEDVHFTPGRRSIPRFLLNDLTRYWRTICVDYAAKHREQDGKKWAIRNAKLRFSRKLIFASGLAFCLSCQLNPPDHAHPDIFGGVYDEGSGPAIRRATTFARTPSLEYLAAFVDSFVTDPAKKKRVAELIFGNYDWWLRTIAADSSRMELEQLGALAASQCKVFQEVRNHSKEFAKGLELLFFNRDRDQESDSIANVALQYVGF